MTRRVTQLSTGHLVLASPGIRIEQPNVEADGHRAGREQTSLAGRAGTAAAVHLEANDCVMVRVASRRTAALRSGIEHIVKGDPAIIKTNTHRRTAVTDLSGQIAGRVFL